MARGRILVVEDSVLIALKLADMLESLGLGVVGPAPSIDRARTLLEAHRVDAALLDVNLDGAHVFPLAAELQERGIPFGLATGYGEAVVPQHLTPRCRLSKPVGRPELARAVNDLLDGATSAA